MVVGIFNALREVRIVYCTYFIYTLTSGKKLVLKIKDQLYRILTLTQTPKRIISLVPSQTELLVDLGLEDTIVGVTKFCVHPKHLRKEKIVVGGTKNVNYQKIRDLQQKLLFVTKRKTPSN